VRDQQQERARGRLLQQLQDRVRGVGVHLVGGIDDHHPPPAIGGAQAEEIAQPRTSSTEITCRRRCPRSFGLRRISFSRGSDSASIRRATG
jgi:hypothetical protein